MTALEELTIRSKIKSHVTKDQKSKNEKLVHETEVHAYAHILQELKTKKGWNKEQIFTQNEVQRIKEIKNQLGGGLLRT